MSTAATTLKQVRVSMMNAVHDLPLLVARDEGLFRDEGLDVGGPYAPYQQSQRLDTYKAWAQKLIDALGNGRNQVDGTRLIQMHREHPALKSLVGPNA